MLAQWFYGLCCRLGYCLRCEVYETGDGIGGRCVDCGSVHGWMTSEELDRVGERHFGRDGS